MSNPKHTLFWMTLFLAIVLAVCVLIYRPLATAFMANWVFNLLIVCVLLVGIGLTYRQVFVLFPELRWIAQFRTGHAGLSVLQEPRLLKPLAKQLGDNYKRDQFSLSTMSLRTVLDGIHTRMDEQREITRYFISLLVFLGLLGTFWGLLGTINAVGGVIAGLDMGQGDFGAVFAELQAGLMTPLQGMGTAFSSSLLGLGGSLILGFLDIQAGHAQNRFYDGLEEWLTGVTNLVDTVAGPAVDTSPVDLEQLREENERLRSRLRDQGDSDA
ncbi:MAG: flagellar motor protein MotA [Marinobacter sp.]|uniref:flagellar motor protein MotA n=1 Tax=Marinobacter sp. TaxID=50741 RepID=UPI00299DA80F|nr:flagellar motor protein MotA [Marinobacter sp.]MDX1634085.1 flagellar motor protein MotA [Marinobacter sp.]